MKELPGKKISTKKFFKGPKNVALKKIFYKKNPSHDAKVIFTEFFFLFNFRSEKVKIYDVFYDTENFYIVSELCTGRELFEHIGKQGNITEALAAKIMKGLISAVASIHRNNMAHRNIKPESLRFDKDTSDAIIKITNFTNAELVSDYEPFKDLLGTPEYLAPEMIDELYNNSVDVWACGVTLYIMLCGKAPFTGKSRQETFDAINPFIALH